jgi:hypothetical protein
VIGIHVRAFDIGYDWAVVSPDGSTATTSTPPPTSSSSSTTTASQDIKFQFAKSARFDEASPLEAFIAIMHKILEFQPNILFFIASNSVVAKNEIASIFPSNYIAIYQNDLIGDSHYR